MGVKIKSQQSTYGLQQNRKNPWTKKYPPPKKKISHAEFSRLETPKNVFCFINNIMQSDIRFFWIRKKIPDVKQTPPPPPPKKKKKKKNLPKFPTQTNPGIKNFKPPKILR